MNNIVSRNQAYPRNTQSNILYRFKKFGSFALKISAIPLCFAVTTKDVLATTSDSRVNNIYAKLGAASLFACEEIDSSGDVTPCGSGISIVGGFTSNAWSRGGRIFLTRRIVRGSSDDELAYVIAHELSHVILDHAGSSVKNELEADTWAAKLLYRSGFDSGAAKTVLSSLQYTRILGFPFSLFSHPANSRRLRTIGLSLAQEMKLNSDRQATEDDATSTGLMARLNSEGPGEHSPLEHDLMASLSAYIPDVQYALVERASLASLDAEGPIVQSVPVTTNLLANLDIGEVDYQLPSSGLLASLH